MARLLLSCKDEGEYEYRWEPVVEANAKAAAEKFLRKHLVIRRIAVNPCDRLYKAKALTSKPGEAKELIKKAREILVERKGLCITKAEEAAKIIVELIKEAEEKAPKL